MTIRETREAVRDARRTYQRVATKASHDARYLTGAAHWRRITRELERRLAAAERRAARVQF